MQAIMPSGKLYNFDLYQERVEQAQKEFDEYKPGIVESKQSNVLEQGFIGVSDNCADLVFLDLPCPEKCLNEVLRVSKNYAHFCVFLPCIEQCHQLIKAMFDSSVNIDKEKQSKRSPTCGKCKWEGRTLGT